MRIHSEMEPANAFAGIIRRCGLSERETESALDSLVCSTASHMTCMSESVRYVLLCAIRITR